MSISNSEYLDPDGFTGDVHAHGIFDDDVCDECGVKDTNENWLIFQRDTISFKCEKCINTPPHKEEEHG